MVTPVTRASAASRWVPCPEAAWLEQQYPDVTSDEAREGTAAHEMAELVLTGQFLIEELVNRQAKNGVMMVGEMIDHVQMYVDHIQSRGVGYWVEESISIPMLNNYQPVTGICDGAGFGFDQATGTLYIDDFKYGHGPVEVFENWQLLIYAIGIANKIITGGHSVLSIQMTIVQPRGYHHQGSIREWLISSDTLNDYLMKLRAAVDRVYSQDRQCHSGGHCRYCKVHAFCATRKAASMNAVDVIMSSLPDTDTPEQVAALLNMLKHASDTVKHTYSAIEARAEAMIAGGQPIPGYGFEPGTGKTKWKNKEQAVATCACFGVDIIDDGVCTPAEGKRRGVPQTVYDDLTTIPSTAPRLVKRDASILADKVFNS